MSLLSAFFGRTDRNGGPEFKCGKDRMQGGACGVSVTQELQSYCAGKSVCTLKEGQSLTQFFADRSITDPCPNYYKYLNYTFRCL